jgi:hypothetical protein
MHEEAFVYVNFAERFRFHHQQTSLRRDDLQVYARLFAADEFRVQSGSRSERLDFYVTRLGWKLRSVLSMAICSFSPGRTVSRRT